MALTALTKAEATKAKAPMSLKISDETREGLRSLSIARKRPAHALAREAVTRFVEAELARDQFTREADEAWNNYQETGLHATQAEVSTWLDSLGTQNELPKPQCHV